MLISFGALQRHNSLTERKAERVALSIPLSQEMLHRCIHHPTRGMGLIRLSPPILSSSSWHESPPRRLLMERTQPTRTLTFIPDYRHKERNISLGWIDILMWWISNDTCLQVKNQNALLDMCVRQINVQLVILSLRTLHLISSVTSLL